MSVLLESRPKTSTQEVDDAQALFAEARARRQRLRFLAATFATLLIAGGLTGANVSGLFGSHQSVLASHPNAAALATSASNPRSEIVTISVASTPVPDPYHPIEQLREAVTLGTSRPSVEVLAANGIEFSDLPKIVNGVYYAKAAINKAEGWQVVRQPVGLIAPALSPAATTNSLAFVKQLAIGPLVKTGEGSIDGESTTDYRVTISVVKRYTLATPAGSLASLIYKLAYPAPGSASSPQLTFPLEVWVDPRGRVLRARTATPAVPPTYGYGKSAATYTVTLSDFGVAVKVAAPARRELLRLPNAKSYSATVSGTVFVRSPTGSDVTEPGLLLFSTTVVSGSGARLKPFAEALSIGRNGKFTTTVAGSAAPFPQVSRLGATFYPERGGALKCETPPAQQFPAGTSTRGIEIVCA